MAPIEAELIEADSQGMVAAILSRAKRRCLVVLLTDLNSASLEEGLMPVLPQLSSRHLVLVASVSDPLVAAMAAARATAEQVYDAAAAEHARPNAAASPPGCAATASRWWTRFPRTSLPPWPTPTWPSRPQAVSRLGRRRSSPVGHEAARALASGVLRGRSVPGAQALGATSGARSRSPVSFS